MAAYKPLLSHGWITAFMWIFIIAGISSLLWYLYYIFTSRDQVPKTKIIALLTSSFLLALSIQFYLMVYDVPINL